MEKHSKEKKKRNQVTGIFISRQGSNATMLHVHLNRFGAAEFFTWGCCPGLCIPGTDMSKMGQISRSENRRALSGLIKAPKGVRVTLTSLQRYLLGEFPNHEPRAPFPIPGLAG